MSRAERLIELLADLPIDEMLDLDDYQLDQFVEITRIWFNFAQAEQLEREANKP